MSWYQTVKIGLEGKREKPEGRIHELHLHSCLNNNYVRHKFVEAPSNGEIKCENPRISECSPLKSFCLRAVFLVNFLLLDMEPLRA